jgi:glycosyltransferase involved in cell wall biosynthesis
MKILFVGTLPPRQGGGPVVDAELLTGLVRRGHQCRAFAPLMSDWNADASPLVGHANLQVCLYPVPRFPPAPEDFFRSADLQELHRLTTVPTILAAIANDRPEAILFGAEYFGFDIADVAAAQGIPTLLIAHNGNLPSAVLNGAFSEAESSRLIEQLRHVDCIVAVARHLAEGWKRLGFDNVRTIPNAVDCKVFAPGARKAALLRSLDIAADDVVVIHLSNLKPVKRVGDLIDSAVRALRSNPKLLYVIAGAGPQRGELEQACQQHNIAERFRFTGWLPRRLVPDYLNLADMVIMPSASEGLSLAMLEAQACAKLVLASDIPGARELIRHGETGLLFRVGDVADLADKTLRAANDPQLRAEIGGRARQEAQGRSLQNMVAAYEETLRTLIDAARSQKR